MADSGLLWSHRPLLCVLLTHLLLVSTGANFVNFFDIYVGIQLTDHDSESIADITPEECATKCLEGTITVPVGSCLSFDYDHSGNGACILSTANKDTQGVTLNAGGTQFDYYHRKEMVTPQDCGDLIANGVQISSDYLVGYPQAYRVYCDMDTDGGGWTVIQRRQDGSVQFDRTWTEYEQGFGNPSGEYWLGLENIHSLTTQKQNELYVYLQDWEGNGRHARYSAFSVGDTGDNYRATLSGYTGDAGDDLTLSDDNGRHNINGRQFSTDDQDNDDSSSHCASSYGQGGWWYPTSCGYAMLNGQYLTGCSATSACDSAQGIVWKSWKTYTYSLMKTAMMIRPGNVFTSNACQNNGTLDPGPQGTGIYRCACRLGWTGTHCDQDIDECVHNNNNCDTEATCTNTAGSFTCTCNTGYTGDGVTCADVNECDMYTDMCHPQATCSNSAGWFTCTCASGLIGNGFACEASTDFFSVYSNQALYGHDDEIISSISTEQCARKCLEGTATIPQGECLSFDYYRSRSKCQLSRANQNTSGTTLGPDNQNRFDHYEMKAIISFFDVYADSALAGHDDEVVRPPAVSPRVCALRCLLGDGGLPVGSCLSFDMDDTDPRCLLSRENQVTAGQDLIYSSEFDHYQLNDFCIHDPCFTGYCSSDVTGFSCTCDAGWEGDVCDTDIDECISGTNNCDTEATCTNTAGSFTCTCNTGYTGDGVTCSDVDECSANTDNCDPEATCGNTVGSFICTCNTGFTGDGGTCTDIDFCVGDPCWSGGTCEDGLTGYTCNCPAGAMGQSCETVVEADTCYRLSNHSLPHKDASTACENIGGQLVDIWETSEQQLLASLVQRKTSVSHWTVMKSPLPPLLHADGSLLSVQSAWMSGNTYGPFDVCVLLDYQHNFTGSYRACAEEHYYICESTIVPCHPHVCQNGGNCSSCFSNTTMCDCHPGFTGVFCETDMDECASNPCQNGGRCLDHVNSFSCDCRRGYYGHLCENDINYCDMNPCPPQWVCVDQVEGFHCDAPVKLASGTTYCTASRCGPGWNCTEDGPTGFSCISN
ncbi:NOTCH3 [Branchiostoma lanceolatum]|uniref:NOTCH3 protein n=1 Tax=Branchiostoma lanceolatum TaxID=7740 RepID=A0A8K0A5F9_BRALA|nr:NOTCH3 [Branchiostoma lanceolatum]